MRARAMTRGLWVNILAVCLLLLAFGTFIDARPNGYLSASKTAERERATAVHLFRDSAILDPSQVIDLRQESQLQSESDLVESKGESR